MHVVGFPQSGTSAANAAAGAGLAAAVATQMQLAANNFRYARAILEAPLSTDADLGSAYAAFADTRMWRARVR